MKKNTKRSLLLSVLALILCCAMLAGTTFAWFTDSASSGVNKIQAGTLQIGLEMKDASGSWVDAKGKTLAWQKAAGAPANEQVLWEPGCTYELPALKITNKGNLALQFKVLINSISGDKKLLDAIDFKVEYSIEDPNSEPEALDVDINENTSIPVELPNPMASDPLYGAGIRDFGWTGIPLETTEYIEAGNYGTDHMCVKLSAHMKESAGNEYQGKTLNDFAITVVATQAAGYEYDSVDNKYDKNATYPVVVSNQQQANDAITNAADKPVNIALPSGQTVTLNNDIANGGDNSRDVTFSGDGSQTVDVITNTASAEGGQLNYQRGSSFTFENLTIQAGEGSFDGIVCDELTFKNCTIKGKLTLYGKATFIDCVFDNTMADQYSIRTWGGTDVKFEGCTFNDRNNGDAGKAAIEIGDANYGKHNKFTVVINGSTVASGFAAGQNTNNKLWANKNNMDAAHLTVTIDGRKVQ